MDLFSRIAPNQATTIHQKKKKKEEEEEEIFRA
jgi:hypothetical protein